jgi:hypothetical protein
MPADARIPRQRTNPRVDWAVSCRRRYGDLADADGWFALCERNDHMALFIHTVTAVGLKTRIAALWAHATTGANSAAA